MQRVRVVTPRVAVEVSFCDSPREHVQYGSSHVRSSNCSEYITSKACPAGLIEHSTAKYIRSHARSVLDRLAVTGLRVLHTLTARSASEDATLEDVITV